MFIYPERPGYEDLRWDGKRHGPTTLRPMKISTAYVGMLMGRNLLMASTARYVYALAPFVQRLTVLSWL